MRQVVQLVIRGYKRWLSPMLPVACRYVPTCSEYAEEAVERYGVVRGGLMALWRLLRCNPFGGSGYDPVVKSLKYEVRNEKWEVRGESVEGTHVHSEPRIGVSRSFNTGRCSCGVPSKFENRNSQLING